MSRCLCLQADRARGWGVTRRSFALEAKRCSSEALASAHRIAPRVAILGSREKYAAPGERIIEDEFPGCGPLAGIHAALGTGETDLNVILSVDMPFVPLKFSTYLLERARSRPTALVTVPRIGGIVQGTCIACRRSFRIVCENQLKLGLCKVEDSIRLANPQYIEEQEIRARGIGPDVFRNLNTPEDVAEAQQLEA